VLYTFLIFNWVMETAASGPSYWIDASAGLLQLLCGQGGIETPWRGPPSTSSSRHEEHCDDADRVCGILKSTEQSGQLGSRCVQREVRLHMPAF
jgi:hypothetical protein